MPPVAAVTKNLLGGVKRNSPTILSGFAAAGVISTMVLTVRATSQAKDILLMQTDDEGYVEKLSAPDTAKLVWPYFVPPALTALATIGCIIGAQSINLRRQAALMGAFTLTESAFQDYKDQVAEQLTAPAKEKLETAIAQKHIDENPPATELLMQGDGKVLVLDLFTGRYFRSTQETIRGAVNDINERLTTGGEMFVSLNEFYIILGLEPSIVGETLGFRAPDNFVDVNFNSALAEGGVPCLTISFRALPSSDYDSLH